MKAFTTGPFTGRHAAAIIVAFFAVVVAVNVYMARTAIGTFGGVVVDNSYVASQKYNGWLKEAAKEKALGWSAKATRRGDGRLVVTLEGAPSGAVLKG
ncbi:MAG: FixH family protein, partial [Novosphingobium sp.]